MTVPPDTSSLGVASGPAQRWGNVRLVPLLRSFPVEGLHLHPDLSGARPPEPEEGAPEPVAYLPHAYVERWDQDPFPSASYGARLCDPGRPASPTRVPLSTARPRPGHFDRPRFLPWTVSVAGHLERSFADPSIAWERFSLPMARRDRLSPPRENASTGDEVGDLERALEVFEIHPDQCGVALYVGDEPASAHLTPHPHDYRRLHSSLLLDLFGETLYTWGLMAPESTEPYSPLPEREIRTLADLRRAVARNRAESSRLHNEEMASSFISPGSEFTRIATRGDFTLWNMRPPLIRGTDRHVGEVITGPDGLPAYLSTFRLSTAQVRRGRLLRELSRAEGRLDRTAASLEITEAELIARLERAGLESVLDPNRLARARSEHRRGLGRR